MQKKRTIHTLGQDPGPNSLLNASNSLIQVSSQAEGWKREQGGTALLRWGRGCEYQSAPFLPHIHHNLLLVSGSSEKNMIPIVIIIATVRSGSGRRKSGV